jgi:hypothetical protein
MSGDGQLLVSCCKEGYLSVWGREVTSRPGKQAKRQRKIRRDHARLNPRLYM